MLTPVFSRTIGSIPKRRLGLGRSIRQTSTRRRSIFCRSSGRHCGWVGHTTTVWSPSNHRRRLLPLCLRRPLSSWMTRSSELMVARVASSLTLGSSHRLRRNCTRTHVRVAIIRKIKARQHPVVWKSLRGHRGVHVRGLRSQRLQTVENLRDVVLLRTGFLVQRQLVPRHVHPQLDTWGRIARDAHHLVIAAHTHTHILAGRY